MMASQRSTFTPSAVTGSLATPAATTATAAAVAVVVATLGLAACTRQEPAPPAELVLRGGRIATMDDESTVAQALAVRGGIIAFVGDDAGAAALVGPGTRVIELLGKMVLPGFHDAHVHPVSAGVELGLCDLNGITDRERLFEVIRGYAGAHPELPWITGGGFNLPLFRDGRPHRHELDALVPDRPAVLSSADGHTAWANSRALALAGITAATPDPPPDGRIERDRDGSPMGTLREAAAALVTRHAPPLSADDYRNGLRRALALAARYGITSLVEASASPPIAQAYGDLAARGELSVRAVVSLSFAAVREEADPFARLEEQRARHRGPRLRADSVKLFADGVIEGRTAALLAPYRGEAGRAGTFRGEPVYPPAELARIVRELDRRQFQVHIHTIGDGAVRQALDALEAAARQNPARERRHHLAHIQLIDPADQPRFAALSVIANMQPLWAYADAYMVDLTEPVLGPERTRWLYPFRSLERQGARLAAGSDWSVSSLNPLDAIEVAVTHLDPDAAPAGPWNPEERLTLDSALAAYTRGGAYLMRQEHETGSLEVGKNADLIVLDRDLAASAPSEINQARVLLTLLDGEPTYADAALWGTAVGGQ